jgi:dTDP-glucose pyrophosphorylase
MKDKIAKKTLTYKKGLLLEDVVKKIDSNGDGFLAIVDEMQKLYGVITDGDLRRAFLNKETNVDNIINLKPMTLSKGTSVEKIISILKKKRRRHMPIVDIENVLVDLVILDELEFDTLFEETVVIMAGGMGTRLGELTKHTPKPMLKVGDKPILEHIINNFQKYGFVNFSVSVNYKSEVIKDYFSNGEKLGVDISYIEENKPLGTAGAISLLKEDLRTDDIIVINGDVLANVNFADLLKFHRSQNAAMTICSKEFRFKIPYAVLETTDDDQLLSFKEKPDLDFWVNSGIYVLNSKMLLYLPKDTFYNMTDLVQLALERKESIKIYKTKDFWVDIGQIQDYERAIKEL